ncbi:MAG TPA: hypothetical protein VKE92_03735, partial [Anaerolineales bacterium]|nr:hypothetical protein [Anaerolineales bacterium]
RGIGCVMIIIVPILAYGSAILLVNYGVARGWPIPPNWLGAPGFHPLLWRLQGLATVLTFLQSQTNLIANLVFAIVITIVIGGIMSMIYGYIYTIFGPPRYGPTDAPPERIKVKKYTR